MALTTFVIYHTTTGKIHHSQNGDSASPPTPPVDHAVMDNGLTHPIPSCVKNSVDIGGPTVLAKSGGTMLAEAQATRKREIEHALADLDIRKPALNARAFIDAEAEVDAEIAALLAEHAALP